MSRESFREIVDFSAARKVDTLVIVSGGDGNGGGKEVRATFDRPEGAFEGAIWVRVPREAEAAIIDGGIPKKCIFDFGDHLKVLLWGGMGGVRLYGEDANGGDGIGA